ncbi:MAG: hypothetical protein R3B97_10310 [Dehalococcoidia bacterium]|nr:hypothetical protein [Dehalococcoidia bacterium]MCB9484918.1 hypothetical protein [Thermoflexaceae bacterium]
MVTDALLMRRPFLNGGPEAGTPATGQRKRSLAWGALAGLVVGGVARVWMRTLTEEDPVFSVAGTVFILLVFSGLGACGGLALAWRRTGSPRRMLVQRGLGLLPTAFMGPFFPFFLPALFGALLSAFPGWGRWRRRSLWGLIVLLSGFLLLISLSRGPIGIASYALWMVVSYAFFLSYRIVFEPRGSSPAAGHTQDATA